MADLARECGAVRQGAACRGLRAVAAAIADPVDDAPAGEDGFTVADAAPVGMGPVSRRRQPETSPMAASGQRDGGVHQEQPGRTACCDRAGHSLPKREFVPVFPEPALTRNRLQKGQIGPVSSMCFEFKRAE